MRDEPAREATPDYFASTPPVGKKPKKSKKKSNFGAFDWDTPEENVPTPDEPQIEPESRGGEPLPLTELPPPVQLAETLLSQHESVATADAPIEPSVPFRTGSRS